MSRRSTSSVRSESINRSASVKQKVPCNTRRSESRADMTAVATFTAADRKLSIAHFVVNVSMLPGKTIVPKLPAPPIDRLRIENSGSISRHVRQIRTGITVSLRNSTFSGRMRLHGAAGSSVTTGVHAAFGAVCRDRPTCGFQFGNTPRQPLVMASTSDTDILRIIRDSRKSSVSQRA